MHYFDNKTTQKILAEIKRILKPNSIHLCRVNSIKDINHGAEQGEEIEKVLYYNKGRYKRVFDYPGIIA